MKVSAVIAVLTFTAAQAAAVAEADPRQRAPWSSCGFPGIICAKTKRSALAVAEAIAEPRQRAPWSSCGFPGIICAKARRSLEELGATTEKVLDNILALDKDDAAAHQRDSLITAHFPGTVRVSKREADPRQRAPWSSCGFPGIICAKAKRGIELVQEEFPNIYKDECFAEGGECHTILKARAAFAEAVRREGGPVKAAWHKCGMPGITCARDVYDYAQASLNGTAPAEVIQCTGPNGECTKAEQYFKQLDEALNKATEEILKA